MNPQKNETVLDPACGTAGFLLSAYKHILTQNTAKRQGDKLTPDQRRKLATSFVGYDISPDMVRLSLANMYLHGFATPQIHEYDTLSSEDRWNETFDVILANPPFMTPKGGIRPHKRFSVQANKAEVLFTDYIAEHLNNNGRAGIVVPNGIVATGQTAYKQLRKMLVADCLIAVISLPAGVFQPYSGVKTSVLILDKRLAKMSQHILFLKIENDGFDLGAQRREHDKNDLPLALQTLEKYKECLSNNKELEDLPSLATLVLKETVLGNKNVVLCAERYFETEKAQTEFEIVKLGEIVEINSKAIDPTKAFGQEPFTYIDIESVENGTGKVSFDKVINPQDAPSRARRVIKIGDVIISTVRPNLRAFAYLENLPKNCLASTGFAVLSENERILGKYLYYIVNQDSVVSQMVAMSGKGQYPSVTESDIAEIEIPLPPLSIQQQIVTEIEGYQKIIDGAKQVVNNYKPTITIKPEWEMVELGALATNISSGATPLGGKENYKQSGVLFIRSQNVLWGETDFSDAVFITEETHMDMKRSQVKFEDVFLNITGASIGRSAVMKKKMEANVNQHVVFIRTIKEKLDPYYLSTFLNSPFAQNIISNAQTGAARQAINYEQIKELQIPLPPLSEQTEIIHRIEEEQALVNANKKLIELFEQKIEDKINEVWGVKAGVYQLENENLSMAAEP